MTDTALTMALGAVAEVKPYGAVVVTATGSVADARDLLPRVLDAMFAHGLVPCGDPAIESNGDGSVAIEVRHAPRKPARVETIEDTTTETVIDDAGAEPTAKLKSGRWHK